MNSATTHDPPAGVLLAQESPRQEELWRVALESQAVPTLALVHAVPIEQAIRGSPFDRYDVLLVDLARVAGERISLAALCRLARERRHALRVVATNGRKLSVGAYGCAWTERQGAAALIHGCTTLDWRQGILAPLRAVLGILGLTDVDEAAVREALRSVVDDLPSDDQLDRTIPAQVDLDRVLAGMRGEHGVTVKDRRYRLRTYSHCFVGREAVDWMVRNVGVDREDAVLIGRSLQARDDLHHVVREQPFRDGRFYYRFGGAPEHFAQIDLDALIREVRAGAIEVRDRRYHGKLYPVCFVGAEWVRWLVDRYGLTVEDAIDLGQQLIDLSIAHHVLDQHDFIDGHYFYRFFADER